MPTYEFRCAKCQATTSTTASLTQELERPSCPTCKTTMVRSYGAPLITFKGEGFNVKQG